MTHHKMIQLKRTNQPFPSRISKTLPEFPIFRHVFRAFLKRLYIDITFLISLSFHSFPTSYITGHFILMPSTLVMAKLFCNL